eukprot:6485082-Amphidinium_carterae.2
METSCPNLRSTKNKRQQSGTLFRQIREEEKHLKVKAFSCDLGMYTKSMQNLLSCPLSLHQRWQAAWYGIRAGLRGIEQWHCNRIGGKDHWSRTGSQEPQEKKHAKREC